ncbi:hypothetical protein O9G_005010 [Rozella allomycis CSF55]|uniref:Uncharacterized protein n=1 Tax=Rozella allomycis (strain CSF55) TaxID=988480 RepID=A0A075B3L8_ROZAC|nr:hypothetical protein O9G_005010 [Rozella allomycis CSF55]|eukprot:EPZ35473.1 hypothetical protein O9G_005010 [Rozella allomycis CSF55]
MCRFAFCANTERGLKQWLDQLVSHQFIGRGHMTRKILLADLDQLVSHQTIGRGDMTRKILLADLGIRNTEIDIVYVWSRDGKENKRGRFDLGQNEYIAVSSTSSET